MRAQHRRCGEGSRSYRQAGGGNVNGSDKCDMARVSRSVTGGTVMYSWPWSSLLQPRHGHEYMTVPPEQVTTNYRSPHDSRSSRTCRSIFSAVRNVGAFPTASKI